MKKNDEVFISVDVEAAGPIPGKYSLLSIGACLTSDTDIGFSCELKPVSTEFVPEALEVTGFSLEKLKIEGLPPTEAMQAFKDWVDMVTAPSQTPVFVGLNAPFDWAFVNHYFHIYLGENPFGFTALDIKALFMGMHGTSWSKTRSSHMAASLSVPVTGDHNALRDAIYQAKLFNAIRKPVKD
ncbi:3'-5' exonuclease [Xenorhabdus bovienii]|uniref:3'-5' exonuclease n=1 Tax=Xenorhabdus bovienii TaxID=40576 RepID=A0AAJ1JCJ7_XENBV|nr:3'-5' exonuclease [Xenorhabdus bovienii]MDE1480157.1 3'-5' exonuclease [Xenorhabdus bovienii]MDE1488346.1 3'-5' exonuclease [Xenorhabdus bovienii]MDE1492686.1 3'-5' exonuclease [Xenorhabdus bovienii]MDE1496872.1 3'-5' exonuclease [Xenorhabdus bovienii]MDE9474759.1 3'-5' exonuclease [Xenorhabdus bovienii]